MRKYLFGLSLALTAVPVLAQINGNGYYRAKNYTTERYITVVDNKSEGVDVATTTADLGAMCTIRSWDRIESNPASVLYLEYISGDQYNVKSQGCDAHAIMGFYLRLAQLNGYPSIYKAYQTKSGTTAYLSDEIGDWDEALLNTNEKRAQNWVITPVDANTDNYFGIKPTVVADGKNYASFYASFPFKYAADGMKAMYITLVDGKHGAALYKDYTEDIIPAATPIIIECPSTEPSGNKVDLLPDTKAAPTDNKLIGVYFNWDYSRYHTNQVVYDANTMRVLGTCADGRLGFVKAANLSTIPANTHYIMVDEGSEDEIKIMTQEEYDEILAAGISDMTIDNPAHQAVYTINGVKIANNATEASRLPRGIYIIGNKKVVIK
ncbi:MAG: hypothetical protein SOV40_02095 [Prevotella sp.]|nr:hypothetical protein [Prevotella sp.]